MRYRAGIIGCGSIAGALEDDLRGLPGLRLFPHSHASVYRAHSDTELVAAADHNPERLASFCDRWGIAARYTSYLEMLSAERLDVVSIATNTESHAQIAVAAASAGVRGIFLEKPIARTLIEADAMIEACAANAVAVAVNYFRNYDPVVRSVATLIREGGIGDVHGVLAMWHQGLAQGASHLFELLRFLLGSHVSWVFAHSEEEVASKDPGLDAYFVFASGVRAHLHMPTTGEVPASVRVIGSSGTVELGKFEMRYQRFVDVRGRLVPVEWPMPIAIDGRSGMLVALDELLGAIDGGTRPTSSLQEGRHILEVTAAMRISARDNRPVSLPIREPGFVVDSLL